MQQTAKTWRTLFFFGLGLALGATLCMKWLETDFWIKGERFTILGLELFYSREKLAAVLSGLDPFTRRLLSYHLYFDFAFMAGIYPAIVGVCMMAREKLVKPGMRMIFSGLALLQFVAWGCDITENYYLLGWLQSPVNGDEVGLYHFIVSCKWIIAGMGILLAAPFMLMKKKPLS